MAMRPIAIPCALTLALALGCSSGSDPSGLVQALKSGDAAKRDAAVAELVALGPELGPVLVEVEKAVLADDVAVRAAAVQVLAKQPEAGRAGLLVALGDDDPTVRAAAAKALGGAGEKAIPGLVEHLADSDFRVAAAAEKSLVQIGDAARPALARAAVTGNADARDWAMRALVELGPGSAADLIAATRSADPEVRRAAIESLFMLELEADVVEKTYRAGLRDEDESVRDAAARGMKALGLDPAEAAR